MTKLRGKKRWKNAPTLFGKLMAAEILLDSLHQKALAKTLSPKDESKIAAALDVVR